MKVVYSWLKEFVDVPVAADELASKLALTGTNIAGVEHGPYGAVIDAEVTSNRPDCLGHLGMAREVSAIYGLALKNVAPQLAASSAKALEPISVDIRTPEFCGRFTARAIRGVKIQPSPQWLKDRLAACGVASINNVVDVSNYVMLELGHPLHTFDYDKIREHRIVVRRANPGEKTRTLDGVERVLDGTTGVISDGDGTRVVGIAGIMGGAETEISFSTRNVLIECAWFNPIAVRRSARLLRLHTEASTRFGRGADPEMAETASRRCAELILRVAGGELQGPAVDEYPGKPARKKIRVTRTEFLRVMGAEVADKEVEATLPSGSTITAGRVARCWRRGNARNLPGAPTWSARSI
jgi:phenylalanyl-tRNA synthetase beta chain